MAVRFFRVAVEGDTTDGRKISRQDILDCAETFAPELYGVRVNLEHYRGLLPNGPFDMLGDVVAVKAEEIDLPVGNVTQKAMALFAAIKPLPALVEINKKKQKTFSSIEIGQNCRGTGKAYLVGLAVTDSPASFGTEVLEFAAKTGFFANRKLADDNLLCQSHEIPQEIFAPDQPEVNADHAGFFASAKALFDRFAPSKLEEPVTPAAGSAPQPEAAPPASELAAFGMLMGQMAATMERLSADTNSAVTKLSTDLAALTAKVDDLPSTTFSPRAPATGGEGAIKAKF